MFRMPSVRKRFGIAAVIPNVRCGAAFDASSMTGSGAMPNVRSCARWQPGVTKFGRKLSVWFLAIGGVKQTG